MKQDADMKLPQQTSRPRSRKLPTFSIAFETDNLSLVEGENVLRSLASLNLNLSLSNLHASEIFFIHNGTVDSSLLKQVLTEFPNTTFLRVDKDHGYYEGRMGAAENSTGEIFIFCDSDCQYQPGWLVNMLEPFAADENAVVVRGETSMPVRNSYELALALEYFFPRFSGQGRLYSTDFYYGNNVAFRRQFLLRYRIPSNQPLYRSHCRLHSFMCVQQGFKILAQPRAQAVHEPLPWLFFIRRHMLWGHDSYRIRHLMNSYIVGQPKAVTARKSGIGTRILGRSLTFARALVESIQRAVSVFKENPGRLVWLPLALPVVLTGRITFCLGYVLAALYPQFLLADCPYNKDGNCETASSKEPAQTCSTSTRRG